MRPYLGCRVTRGISTRRVFFAAALVTVPVSTRLGIVGFLSSLSLYCLSLYCLCSDCSSSDRASFIPLHGTFGQTRSFSQDGLATGDRPPVLPHLRGRGQFFRLGLEP
jgi:hypothetical protein